MPFWRPPENPVTALIVLLRQLIALHGSGRRATKLENRSDNGQFRTDFRTDFDHSGSHAQAELFRLAEWALCMEIISAANSRLAHMKNHPRRVSLAQIAKALAVASSLGRRASGLPMDNKSANPSSFPSRPQNVPKSRNI